MPGASMSLFTTPGHMVFGPAEAFTPDQLAELYDINVLSTQRVESRGSAASARAQGKAWSSGYRAAVRRVARLTYLAPYFASKAGMDAMAVQYARELTLWGIETSIVVPGAFTGGTNHFAHSGTPADKARAAEYDAGPYKGYGKKIQEALPRLFRPMRTRARSPKRSLLSWTRPSASVHFAFMSIDAGRSRRSLHSHGPGPR